MGVLHLLPLRVTHKRRTPTTVKGRSTFTWDTVTSSLPARIHTPNARELEQAQRMETRADVVLYFEPGVDVHRDDAIETADGTSYLVTARLPPSLPHHLKCYGKQVQLGSAD